VAYRLFAYDRPHTAILTIGSKQMDVNVDSYELDVAPYIKNGYTMVPLRFVAEALEQRWAGMMGQRQLT